MLVCLPAANIYDVQERVSAHKHTPASREALKRLQALAPRLRELGVTHIVCSDLDGQSGEALGRRLNVPVEEWESLRRFNWGKLHGAQARRAYDARPSGQPIVPVRGGDSQTSFEKRIAASKERLSALPAGTLLIADPEVLEKLTGAGSAVRYRVYEVQLGEPDKAQAVGAAAPGRCVK